LHGASTAERGEISERNDSPEIARWLAASGQNVQSAKESGPSVAPQPA
jgi:hypothetical protein